MGSLQLYIVTELSNLFYSKCSQARKNENFSRFKPIWKYFAKTAQRIRDPIKEIYSQTFLQKFRESNIFKKQVTKELVSRKKN